MQGAVCTGRTQRGRGAGPAPSAAPSAVTGEAAARRSPRSSARVRTRKRKRSDQAASEPFSEMKHLDFFKASAPHMSPADGFSRTELLRRHSRDGPAALAPQTLSPAHLGTPAGSRYSRGTSPRSLKHSCDSPFRTGWKCAGWGVCFVLLKAIS